MKSVLALAVCLLTSQVWAQKSFTSVAASKEKLSDFHINGDISETSNEIAIRNIEVDYQSSLRGRQVAEMRVTIDANNDASGEVFHSICRTFGTVRAIDHQVFDGTSVSNTVLAYVNSGKGNFDFFWSRSEKTVILSELICSKVP